MPRGIDIRGLEFTTAGTPRACRNFVQPDYALLRGECPRGAVPDTGLAETVGRLLGWDETRIDEALTAGLRAGVFLPR